MNRWQHLIGFNVWYFPVRKSLTALMSACSTGYIVVIRSNDPIQSDVISKKVHFTAVGDVMYNIIEIDNEEEGTKNGALQFGYT